MRNVNTKQVLAAVQELIDESEKYAENPDALEVVPLSQNREQILSSIGQELEKIRGLLSYLHVAKFGSGF